MRNNERIMRIAYKYVFAMCKSKKYNLQAIANIKFLENKKEKDIINMLKKPVKDFCKEYKCDKVKDFVYKNDYFTPRKVYLISPTYYIYYTYIVFNLADIYLKGEIKLDFSKDNISVFYYGTLVLKEKLEEINQCGMVNKSYSNFQNERNKYLGCSVLKIDIQNFFDNIQVHKLIDKLKRIIDDKEVIDELDLFFEKCDINTLPQLHYSIASSILSQFYLVDFDKELEKIATRDKLHIIRFVDDTYIIHLDKIENIRKNNRLLNEISYFLWQNSLALNISKIKILSAEEFEKECKIMFSNYFQFTNFSIEKFIHEKVKQIVDNGYLIKLVEELINLEKTNGIDLKEYKEIVDEYISIKGENSKKIVDHLIFSPNWKKINNEDMIKIIDNWKFILFNPNQFTILYILIYRYLERKNVINEDGKRIKQILNYLFLKETFTFRDALVAITYLLQRNFQNRDLLKKIREVNSKYLLYIEEYLKI